MPMARLYKRKWLLIQLPVLLLAAITASWTWLFVYPIPPSHLSITTAATGSAYYRHAQAYAERFAAHGVTLEIQASNGSQQNLERLRQTVNPSDLALVLGGFGYLGASTERYERSRVETLANVDVEGLWIFSRNQAIEYLEQLQGLRVAVGPEGSGSRKVALQLLAQARVDRKDLTLSPMTGEPAVRALGRGQLDAVLLMAPSDSLNIQKLLALPGARLANLHKTAAITERNPYLESRLLAQGALGLGMPPRDITLLTTQSSLVARESLHPALKRLAIAVAMDVNTGSGLFHRAGDFPSLRRLDFPTAPQARKVLASGLPTLEQWMPFWWAQVAERILLIVLPVSLVALSLMALIPRYLRWALESRVNRWYGELKFIENDLKLEAHSDLTLAQFMPRLDRIDKALRGFACPPDLVTRCYTLHHHIEFVRQRLYGMRGR